MADEVDYRNKVDELEKIFKSLPTCKDGYIRSKDFTNLCKELQYERSEEQLQAFTGYWDKYHEGKISLENYLALFTSVYKTSELARHYAIITDVGKTGFISSDEFLEIASLMTIHDTRLEGISFAEFVEKDGTNQEGKVSINECAAWIEKGMNTNVHGSKYVNCVDGDNLVKDVLI